MSDNSLKSNYRSGPAWKAPKLAATDGRAARNAFSKFDYDVVHVHEEAWRRAVHNWYEFARARSGLEKWSAEIPFLDRVFTEEEQSPLFQRISIFSS